MSPEERAKSLREAVLDFGQDVQDCGWFPGISNGVMEAIASAIREAESSANSRLRAEIGALAGNLIAARNEALEEAAVLLEQGLTDVRHNRGSGTTSSPWAASVVRNLKTKD